jgi:hypothetical protein
MSETPEQSDQLPEEAPPEQVHEDTSGNRGSDRSPGVPGAEETGPGTPDAAGVDDEGSAGDDEEDPAGA